MLYLKTLHVENFMSINSQDFEFSPQCTIAITGKNGAGKSALFYAIAFCLTEYRKGDSFRDYVKVGEETSIINLTADLKGYPVTYEVEISNRKYGPPTKRKVTYRDKVYLNSEYRQFVEEHELDYLESLMFMFQGSSSDIIEARPAERANILRRLFKFEFPEIINAYKEKQEQDKINDIQLQASIQEAQTRKYEKSPLIRTASVVQEKEWRNKAEFVEKNLKELGKVDETLIKTNERNIKNIKEDIQFNNKKKALNLSKISSITESLNNVGTFITQTNIGDLREDLTCLNEDLKKSESNFSDLQNLYNKKMGELEVLKHEYFQLQKQLEVSRTGKCHSCGHIIEKAYIQEMENKTNDAKERLDIFKKEIDDLSFTGKNEEAVSLKKEIRNKELLISKYEQSLLDKSSYETQLKELNSEVNERESNLSKLGEQLTSLEKQQEALVSLKPLLIQRDDLEKESARLKSLIKVLEEDRIKNQERIKNNNVIEAEIENNKQRIKELYEKEEKVARRMIETKGVINVFENLFPNYIILQACSKLEEYINYIVQKVFPYCRVSLKLSRGGVNFFYTAREDGEQLPVTMASGAQKMVLSLAYKIALAKLYGLSIIFLDEADASCSSENSQIIYKLIASLDSFQQIFFISHRKESLHTMKEEREDLIMYYVDEGNFEEITNFV